MEKKLCVITGATGHIGYALLKELEKNGEKIRILIRKNSPIFDGIDCEKAYGDVTDLWKKPLRERTWCTIWQG